LNNYIKMKAFKSFHKNQLFKNKITNWKFNQFSTNASMTNKSNKNMEQEINVNIIL